MLQGNSFADDHKDIDGVRVSFVDSPAQCVAAEDSLVLSVRLDEPMTDASMDPWCSPFRRSVPKYPLCLREFH